MSKTRKLGNRNEKLAMDELRESGFLCEQKNYSRWQGKDFYNLFDILAIGKSTKLIQVKTNKSDFYKARKKIQEFQDTNQIKDISLEVWLRREDTKDFRKHICK